MECKMVARPGTERGITRVLSPTTTYRCFTRMNRKAHLQKSPRAPGLRQLLADSRLIVSQKSFDEFTLATNDHPPEPFEPAALRNLRLRCEPFRKGAYIVCGEMAAINAIK
jgi:hypothetical protein